MSELRFTPEEAAGLIGAVAASPLGQRDPASAEGRRSEATALVEAMFRLAAVLHDLGDDV